MKEKNADSVKEIDLFSKENGFSACSSSENNERKKIGFDEPLNT